MPTNASNIVHTLNGLIAEAETRLQSIEMSDRTMGVRQLVEKINGYKRAIGQLKAARTSFIASGDMEVAA